MNIDNVWLITAKTKLHVGDENASSYGLIDKAIQRDALTELPCINSSSLKGAINEYCCYGNNGKEVISSEDRKDVFGADKRNGGEASKGGYVFFDAQILLLPIPDDNNIFKLITSEFIIRQFTDRMSMFGITGIPSDSTSFITWLANKIGISHVIETVSYEVFKDKCSDDNLPIIARNHLDNGQSTNLWYEQVLPPETVMYTFIEPKKVSDGEDILSKSINKQIIQVGANASIGYGYCRFKHLEKKML